MRPNGLPRWLRIKRRPTFLRAQRRGTKHHTRHFLVFVIRARRRGAAARGRDVGVAPSRLGITVTKKVGAAHQRNRIKRLVREVFRQERERIVSGLDIVFVAKRGATSVTLEALRTDFVQLAKRLHRDHSQRVG